MKWFAICVLVFVGCEESQQFNGEHPRAAANGPEGYLNQERKFRDNLSQTGVWDQGTPLHMRQGQARKLGYPVPTK